jgi:hypothetical protein
MLLAVLAMAATLPAICEGAISFRMPFKCGAVIRTTQDGNAVSSRTFFLLFSLFVSYS